MNEYILISINFHVYLEEQKVPKASHTVTPNKWIG